MSLILHIFYWHELLHKVHPKFFSRVQWEIVFWGNMIFEELGEKQKNALHVYDKLTFIFKFKFGPVLDVFFP